jgi:hypothetical protein
MTKLILRKTGWALYIALLYVASALIACGVVGIAFCLPIGVLGKVAGQTVDNVPSWVVDGIYVGFMAIVIIPTVLGIIHGVRHEEKAFINFGEFLDNPGFSSASRVTSRQTSGRKRVTCPHCGGRRMIRDPGFGGGDWAPCQKCGQSGWIYEDE